MTKRNTAFLLLCAATTGLYFIPLRQLLSLALHNEAYSYILLVPFISAWFFYKKINGISSHGRCSIAAGCAIALPGVFLWAAQWFPFFAWISNDRLTWMSISMLLFFWGGCAAVYGMRIFKHAAFPVFFLLFVIPLPASLLEAVIHFFQWGTALVVEGMFKAARVTYLRDGFSFHLPTISVQIASECSGIRSSTALVITAVVAGQVFLRTAPGKAALALLSIPLAVLKNGIRVSTLALLGDRVDAHFITKSNLHHKGGFVFFLIALLLLLLCMHAIARIEAGRKRKMLRCEDVRPGGEKTSA